MIKIFNYSIKILFIVFLLFNILLLISGIHSIFSTLFIYFFLYLTTRFFIKAVVYDSPLRSNLLFSISFFFLLLFSTEVVLKFILRKHLSYSESSGSFFYSSPYDRYGLGNIIYPLFGWKTNFERVSSTGIESEYKQTPEFHFLHTYNKYGLRGSLPLLSSNVPEADKIIITLGDSYTEGLGAPQDSTWVALLTLYLNSSSDTGKIYQYINGGLIGCDPIVNYLILKRILKDYKPSDVILAVNYSDLYDIVTKGGFERFVSDYHIVSKTPPWFDVLYGSSTIVRIIVHDLFHYNYFLISNEQYQGELENAMNVLVEGIKSKYIPLSQEHGFKFWVVFHPLLNELQQDSFMLNGMYKELTSLPQIRLVNLFTHFKKRCDSLSISYEELYWPIDGHHNPKGYNLWAKCLFLELTNEY